MRQVTPAPLAVSALRGCVSSCSICSPPSTPAAPCQLQRRLTLLKNNLETLSSTCRASCLHQQSMLQVRKQVFLKQTPRHTAAPGAQAWTTAEDHIVLRPVPGCHRAVTVSLLQIDTVLIWCLCYGQCLFKLTGGVQERVSDAVALLSELVPVVPVPGVPVVRVAHAAGDERDQLRERRLEQLQPPFALCPVVL